MAPRRGCARRGAWPHSDRRSENVNNGGKLRLFDRDIFYTVIDETSLDDELVDHILAELDVS